VILGASKKSQLFDNIKDLDIKSKMTHDVMAKIEQIIGNNTEPARAFALE
jgi:aryl-alcohol dehydrogenase-like predicted oxidoreductase